MSTLTGGPGDGRNDDPWSTLKLGVRGFTGPGGAKGWDMLRGTELVLGSDEAGGER